METNKLLLLSMLSEGEGDLKGKILYQERLLKIENRLEELKYQEKLKLNVYREKLFCHLIITASYMIKSSIISNFSLSFVLIPNAEAALTMLVIK